MGAAKDTGLRLIPHSYQKNMENYLLCSKFSRADCPHVVRVNKTTLPPNEQNVPKLEFLEPKFEFRFSSAHSAAPFFEIRNHGYGLQSWTLAPLYAILRSILRKKERNPSVTKSTQHTYWTPYYNSLAICLCNHVLLCYSFSYAIQ